MSTQDGATARDYREAAERAEAATLWDEAVPAYEAALSIVADGSAPAENEAALLTALGRCYWNLSDARTAWRTLRRAITLCREHDDGRGMARATVELLRIWGPPERQRAMAEEALEALGDADPHLRAQLLLRLRWDDEDPLPKFNEAMAIAERHNFEDILGIRLLERAFQAYEQGRLDESILLRREAHEAAARLKLYDQAAGALRAAAFLTLDLGRLDAGFALAVQTMEYARGVHLRFTEQLGLTDAAGVLFARGEYDRCRALLAELPTNTDFRADLYRMWIVELSGDTRGAVALMVNPERGGGAPTAMSQTHGAAAGVLYRAGSLDAARHELHEWFEIARKNNALWTELPALADCVVALGDDDLVQEVHDAFAKPTGGAGLSQYATLQGRALGPARGAIALRLGRVDEAERQFRDGLAWCERERCAVDAGLCYVGLADIARARDGGDGRADLLAAAAMFERQGAKMWLDRLIVPRLAQ